MAPAAPATCFCPGVGFSALPASFICLDSCSVRAAVASCCCFRRANSFRAFSASSATRRANFANSAASFFISLRASCWLLPAEPLFCSPSFPEALSM